MSATRNIDSLENQGEFRSRVAPSEPSQTSGRKPGSKVGNDAAAEFHAENYPPGTAPDERSFQPRPAGEVPAQALNQSETTDTLPGATSADLDTGLGKPLRGQESRETDRKRKNKREGAGLEGVGASVGPDMAKQKGAHLPEDVEKDTRGKASADYPSASERA